MCMSEPKPKPPPPKSKVLCVGGPWDGQYVEDIGDYARCVMPTPLSTESLSFEYKIYRKVYLRTKQGLTATAVVYEFQDVDCMIEFLLHYRKL